MLVELTVAEHELVVSPVNTISEGNMTRAMPWLLGAMPLTDVKVKV